MPWNTTIKTTIVLNKYLKNYFLEVSRSQTEKPRVKKNSLIKKSMPDLLYYIQSYDICSHWLRGFIKIDLNNFHLKIKIKLKYIRAFTCLWTLTIQILWNEIIKSNYKWFLWNGNSSFSIIEHFSPTYLWFFRFECIHCNKLLFY